MARYDTHELRLLWKPWEANSARMVTIPMEGFSFLVADIARDAFDAAHLVAEHHGYVLRAGECGSYNVRRVTGGFGYSLHSYGIAEDWNWHANPYKKRSETPFGSTVTDMPPSMVADIKRIRARRTGELIFRWGGEYRKVSDAMHWEIVVAPDDLRDGIDWTSVVGSQSDARRVVLD